MTGVILTLTNYLTALACSVIVSLGSSPLMGQDLKAFPPGKERVVFMGDSITLEWGQERLFVEHPEFTNRGIPGQTTGQMLDRFQVDVIALKPDVVHIMGGTNDVAENYGPVSDDIIENSIRAMIDLAVANNIKVVLATIPPAKKIPWHPELEPAARIKELNAWLRAYAASRHIVLVDYWTALADSRGGMRPEYSGDGVHPNGAAHAVMGRLLQDALQQVQTNENENQSQLLAPPVLESR
jgi:lysophospholipase L1-like esterase